MGKIDRADLATLGLTEAIQLQQDISAYIKRRFEKHRTLAFVDVVGSTTYYETFGDEAGRGLIERFLAVLRASLVKGNGTLVDTAGDGAFLCFPTAEGAAQSLMELEHTIRDQNQSYAPEHQLAVRTGIHYGIVLTDEHIVSGDSVNTCARIASHAAPNEVVLSRECLVELSHETRLRCRHIGPVELKGIARPVELFELRWQTVERMPRRVHVDEMNETFTLPLKDVITFGRLPANDITLRHPDPDRTQMISRWHFELRRSSEGLRIRALSTKSNLFVNGEAVVPEKPLLVPLNSVVTVAGLLTLRFLADTDENPMSADETIALGSR